MKFVDHDLRPENREQRCRIFVIRELERLHYRQRRLMISKRSVVQGGGENLKGCITGERERSGRL